MVSEKRIKQIYNQHKSAFDVLAEFEKTGKVIVKKRMNFTIDREVSKRFRDYCNSKGENMSALVEKFMRNTAK